MSLLLGIAILALAVLLGGLAALFRERARAAMPAIRTFAVVAAVAIALLHLLPEAIAAIGPIALLAAAVGAVGPAVLERAIPSKHDHTHDAPTTALAMGYAAVIAHQGAEGAALASLAQTGALSAAIVMAVAAHTVPLAMVVAIRVLEVNEVKGASAPGSAADPSGRRATLIALAGVALATALGAVAGSVVGGARLVAVQPWLLALVAGLLLHALSHDVLASPGGTLRARAIETGAGWAGLALAISGVEAGGWFQRVPWAARVAGVLLLAGVIAGRSFAPRRRAPQTEHRHEH